MNTFFYWLSVIYGFSFLFLILIVLGEIIANKFPDTKYYNFWRQYVIGDGETEHWD